MLEIQSFTIKQETQKITKEELLELGIAILDNEGDLDDAVKKLTGTEHSKTDTLEDLGLKLKKLGPLSFSKWALYSTKIEDKFVSDIIQNRNFYTITLRKLGRPIEELRHAYLRKEYIDEDINFYVRNKFEKIGRGEYSVALEGELYGE